MFRSFCWSVFRSVFGSVFRSGLKSVFWSFRLSIVHVCRGVVASTVAVP